MDKLISLKETCNILGVKEWTLRRYPENILPVHRTPKGHRRYLLSDVMGLLGKQLTENKIDCTI